jgi:hypothetical protein
MELLTNKMTMRLFLLLFSSLIATSSCNSQQNNDKRVAYYIEITNFYFGRVDNITILTNDSIKSEINKVRGGEKKYNRLLNDKEKQKIDAFISKLPLTGLKSQYINEKVEDGTQMKFVIKVENNEKSIYVSNEYQDDLGELVELVVSLLPEDYIGYNRKAILW